MSDPTDKEIDEWAERSLADEDPECLDDHWFPHWFRPEERGEEIFTQQEPPK